MDDILVPEIGLEVGEPPIAISESTDEAANKQLPEIGEVPQTEHNGDVSFESCDKHKAIPQSDRNGDVVTIEDTNHNNKASLNATDVPPVLDAITSLDECVEITNETDGDDPILPILNCEAELSEDQPLVEQNNHEIVPSVVCDIDVDSEESKRESMTGQLKPHQIPKDYTAEELEAYNTIFAQGSQQIQFIRIHCTACNVHLGSAPNKQNKRYIHPLLRVLICKLCFEFYGSGEFDKDEDGSELYCRWCGQGGKVLCCAKCPFVFCQRCIKCNLGKSKLQEVMDSEDWLCFQCIPSQTIKLRVYVRSLYDFVQSEINLAAELNEPERLKIDHSLCCTNRGKNVPKIKIKIPATKRNHSDDSGDNVYPKRKKIKLKTFPNLVAPSSGNSRKEFVNPLALKIQKQTWVAQVQDEVVCTPDLSMLMPVANEDEECAPKLQSPLARALTNPPPLAMIKSRPVSKSGVVNPFKTKILPKQLGYKLVKQPVVLNASTTRPILSKALLAPKISGPTPSSTFKEPTTNKVKVTSNIVPGTKYDWFEKASSFTNRVNSNLSTRLSSLATEQSRVNSLEALATIHNNFQEILNNSIKSLTQIRKNLRGDFIAGLKTLKYSSEILNAPLKTKSAKSSDVIIVDKPLPKPSLYGTSLGRLKLKPAASLLVDNAVITIPDDVFDEQPPPTTNSQSEVTEIAAPVVETKEATPPIDETIETVTDQADDGLPDEIRAEIRRALQESRLETIVIENMKVKVPDDITTELLKRMVSVRVVVKNNYSPCTLRTRPHPNYQPMNIYKKEEDDIENLLSSSIVLNISKRKVFNNEINTHSEPILTISDDVEHLSNGIS